MNKVLVVLPNWYGEVLFVTPFLAVLREALPQAHIAVMGWPQTESVLRHSALVDSIILYDEKGSDRSWLSKLRIIRRLQAERFDAAFVLRKSRSRGWLLALAGIPKRIGWSGSKGGALNTVYDFKPWGDGVAWKAGMDVWPHHKAATYMPLLEAVAPGLSARRAPYVFELTQSELQESRALLGANGVALTGKPIVFLHPGANWSYKQWPAERFAELAQRLAAHPVQCVLSGGPDDAALCKAIVAQAKMPLITLQGKTTLRQLAGCFSYAGLMVSNDTGVMHSAVALGCPTVALYGPTSPVLTGPLGDPAKTRVIHHNDCCPQIPCFEPEVRDAPGMRAITVDEVYNAAKELLEQEK